MSRTFRRKNYEATCGCSYYRQFDKIAGFYTVRSWRGPGRAPTVEEYNHTFKTNHRNESRNLWSPSWNHRNRRMRQNRAMTSQELTKFRKNPEYEVMALEEPLSCLWDWM